MHIKMNQISMISLSPIIRDEDDAEYRRTLSMVDFEGNVVLIDLYSLDDAALEIIDLGR